MCERLQCRGSPPPPPTLWWLLLFYPNPNPNPDPNPNPNPNQVLNASFYPEVTSWLELTTEQMQAADR